MVSAQQNEAVIYRFAGAPDDGEFPRAGLVSDPAGNLYGTTFAGGATDGCRLHRGCGAIFELSPPSIQGLAWTETVLYEFPDVGGASVAGLVRDNAGNLYGASGWGEGSIFELSPPAVPGAPWTFANIYFFTGGTDGAVPAATLILDEMGNLYGTTVMGGDLSCPDGGDAGCGTVFELSPPSNPGGPWSENVLYAFNTTVGDGFGPICSLVFDPAGNLYGTTEFGYVGSNVGTAFKISPPVGGSGPWTEEVIYRFMNSVGGINPVAGFVRDAHGNLFGTTEYTGLYEFGYGTVFELSPQPGGHWVENTLYSFTNGSDGSRPLAPPIFDKTGNLYGTTSYGGSASGGTVFELSPNGDGTWSLTTLHEFLGHADGLSPQGGVIFGKGRLLYGTTEYGGSTHHNFGTVFELKP